MKYIGDLYGRVARKYIKLDMTSADVDHKDAVIDSLNTKLLELLGMIKKMKNCENCANFVEYATCAPMDGKPNINGSPLQKNKGCRLCGECKDKNLWRIKP